MICLDLLELLLLRRDPVFVSDLDSSPVLNSRDYVRMIAYYGDQEKPGRDCFGADPLLNEGSGTTTQNRSLQ